MALNFPAIDPIALSIGPIDIRWYALAYLAGFLCGWALLKRFLRLYPSPHINDDMIDDLLTWIVVGVVLGGRLGYVLFYNFDYYSAHPLDALKIWQGGMAFHGGLIGVITAMILFARYNRIPFFDIADRIAVVTPIGLFFGRIANFINAELLGRPWDGPWAIIFREGDVARHPSQIYQALTEGLVLFLFLFILQRYDHIRDRRGLLAGFFLIGYGTMRFFTEFTRKPDAHLGFIMMYFSMGQILCIPMIIIGAAIALSSKQRER